MRGNSKSASGARNVEHQLKTNARARRIASRYLQMGRESFLSVSLQKRGARDP
jgi:hypothetical protein